MLNNLLSPGASDLEAAPPTWCTHVVERVALRRIEVTKRFFPPKRALATRVCAVARSKVIRGARVELTNPMFAGCSHHLGDLGR